MTTVYTTIISTNTDDSR